jgi:hypothetical protein
LTKPIRRLHQCLHQPGIWLALGLTHACHYYHSHSRSSRPLATCCPFATCCPSSCTVFALALSCRPRCIAPRMRRLSHRAFVMRRLYHVNLRMSRCHVATLVLGLLCCAFHAHLCHMPPFHHTTGRSNPSFPATFATQPNLRCTARSSFPPQTSTSHTCIARLAKAPHLAPPIRPPTTPESAKQAGAARQNPTHSHDLHPGAAMTVCVASALKL